MGQGFEEQQQQGNPNRTIYFSSLKITLWLFLEQKTRDKKQRCANKPSSFVRSCHFFRNYLREGRDQHWRFRGPPRYVDKHTFCLFMKERRERTPPNLLICKDLWCSQLSTEEGKQKPDPRHFLHCNAFCHTQKFVQWQPKDKQGYFLMSKPGGENIYRRVRLKRQ